ERRGSAGARGGQRAPAPSPLGRIPSRVVSRRALLHLASWLTPSEAAARRWMTGAAMITIVMLPFAVYQLYDLKEQRERRVVNALLMINQRLDVETSRVIRHRLQSLKPQPLLDASISADSLGDYLDTMESLAS